MIAKLSNDLLSELDRWGDRPLAVEDPRTHRRYWLVADEQNARQSLASSDEWTDEKNARRFALIDKEIEGTLTPAESAELNSLQAQIDDFLRRVAPLPIAETRQLHARLVKLSRNKLPRNKQS